MKTTAAGLILAFATALLGISMSCAREGAAPIVEAPVREGRAIFVLGYGYHTGLAVHARDLPQAAWPAQHDFVDADELELGWGEREYYQREHPGAWLALRALFTPTASTLKVTAVTGPLSRRFPQSEIIELRVSDAGFARMVEFVRQSHELDAAGRSIVLSARAEERIRFYASPGTFHVFENCNVWVARALQAAGLPVNPKASTTAGTLLRQVRPLQVSAPDGAAGATPPRTN
ncbi:MAG TPA: DUF2459 domain-containing protein [Casimicrobiaceae bacterium]